MNIYNIKPSHTFSSPHPCKGFVAMPHSKGVTLPVSKNRTRSGGYVAGLERKPFLPYEMITIKGRRRVNIEALEKRA